MTGIAIQSPIPAFKETDGSPLNAGFLYFGEPNKNPEISPVPVFWDVDLTQPAAQPIRTMGGYPVRNGNPSNVYVSGAYSITVKNKKGLTILGCADALFNVKQPFSGAVPRSQQEKNSEFVSVLDFGADRTGLTGSGASFSNAVFNSDGTLYVPAGVYLLKMPIELSGQGRRIVFDKNATIKRGFSIGPLFYVTGSNWELIGGNIDGDKANYEGGGIFIIGTSNHIEGWTIRNVKGQSIAIDGNSGANFGNKNVIVNNHILDGDAVGVSQYCAKESVISGNRIYNAGAEGITVDCNTTRTRVSDNVIVGAGRLGAVGGIGIDLSYHNNISGNLIAETKNGLPGICLESQAGNTYHNSITSNNIINNSGYGVWVRRRSIIFDVGAKSPVAWDGVSYGQSDWNNITGNNFSGNTLAPIRIDDYCVGNNLVGNNYDGRLPSISKLSAATRVETGLTSFKATLSNTVVNQTGDGTSVRVPFDTIVTNTPLAVSMWDAANQRFVAPISGKYRITAGIRFCGGDVHDWATITIFCGGIGKDVRDGIEYNDKSAQMISVSTTVFLGEGDAVSVEGRVGGGGKTVDIEGDPSYTRLEIDLIS